MVEKITVFLQGAESAGYKSLANGPGLSALLLGALKARSVVQGSRLIQRNIRAKAVTLRAFSAQLSLLHPPGPLGRAITSGAYGAVCN